MDQPAHAPLAPSSADRWVNCGRSPSLESAFPDLEDSDESAEGTAAHWLLAEALSGRNHGVGAMAENGLPINAEMVKHVLPLVTIINNAKAEVPDAELFIEQRVSMAGAIHPDNWGTCDAFLVDTLNRIVYVWDFKFGHGYVEHVGNWQLTDYAQGAIEALGLAPSAFTIHASIYQPRCYSSVPYRTWVCPPEEHVARVGKLHMAAKLVSPNSDATTGPHCKNCKGIRACAANQRMAGYIYDLSLKTTSDSLSGHALGEEYALLLESQARLKSRLVGLEAAISANPAGTGWVLERKEGREKWTVPAEEVFALGDMMGVDLRKPQEPITPVQARENGLDAEVSKAYSIRAAGEFKLVKSSASAIAKAFNT